jgi:hypothetical protein
MYDLPGCYFLLTCGASAASLAVMIGRADLKAPTSCMWWFTWGLWLFGGSLVDGFVVEY